MQGKFAGAGFCRLGCHRSGSKDAWRWSKSIVPMRHMKLIEKVTPGLPIPDVYRTENVELVRAGCNNMAKHIQNAVKFGVPVVVAINKFA